MAVVFPFHSVGSTVSLTTSTYDATWQILDIDDWGVMRAAIETTYMGTAAAGAGKYGNATYIASKIVRHDPLKMKLHFDANKTPPIGEAAESTITVTFPSGTVGGATFVGAGFFTKFNIHAPMADEPATVNVEIQFTGEITVTTGS